MDLFGKPTKSFYAALAPHATDAAQRKRLEVVDFLFELVKLQLTCALGVPCSIWVAMMEKVNKEGRDAENVLKNRWTIAAFDAMAAEGVTIAEILHEFASAHPSIEQVPGQITPRFGHSVELVRSRSMQLAAIVPVIKMRHYSIASSQRVHPTQVIDPIHVFFFFFFFCVIYVG